MSSADKESANPGSQPGIPSIDPVLDNDTGNLAEPGPTLASVVIGVACVAAVIGLFAWLILSDVWVSRAASGEQTVYSWSIWTWLGPFALALGCAIVGVLFACSDRMATAGGWLLILSLFPCVSGLVFACMGIVVPDRYNVGVDAEQFTCRVKEEPVSIRFDELREIHVAESWSLGIRRGIPYPSHSSHVVVVRKDGKRDRLVVGGLLEHALPEIVQRAEKKGVRIVEVKE